MITMNVLILMLAGTAFVFLLCGLILRACFRMDKPTADLCGSCRQKREGGGHEHCELCLLRDNGTGCERRWRR